MSCWGFRMYLMAIRVIFAAIHSTSICRCVQKQHGMGDAFARPHHTPLCPGQAKRAQFARGVKEVKMTAMVTRMTSLRKIADLFVQERESSERPDSSVVGARKNWSTGALECRSRRSRWSIRPAHSVLSSRAPGCSCSRNAR